MKAITLFGGEFTGIRQIGQLAASKLGYRMIQDRELIKLTAQKHPVSVEQIKKSIYRKPPFRGNYSRKKARTIAALKNTLVDLMEKEPAVYCGFIGQLIPSSLALRVLVAAGSPHRADQAFRNEGLAGKTALRRIRKGDRDFFGWTRYLQEEGLWDAAAFDVTIFSDNMHRDQSLKLILRALDDRSSHQAEKDAAADNFKLAARVESTLAQKGFRVGVSVMDRRVELTIRNPVTFLSRFEKKLKQTISGIPDIQKVQIHVGSRFYQANICRGPDFHLPYKLRHERIEKEYARIYSKMAEGHSISIKNRAENHQRLWT